MMRYHIHSHSPYHHNHNHTDDQRQFRGTARTQERKARFFAKGASRTMASQASTPLKSRGREMALTPAQGKILYGRHMVLLPLSLVVGGRTLLAICGSWRQTQRNSVRHFANLMVSILLFVELLQTIGLVGVNIASAVDGVGPWRVISMECADKMCARYGAAILDFWTDMMVSGTQSRPGAFMIGSCVRKTWPPPPAACGVCFLCAQWWQRLLL
jgi:hypothetical protein